MTTNLPVFRALDGYDLPNLYQLMVEEDFPDVPETLAEALPMLAQTRSYGLFESRDMCAGFVFGDITPTNAFFDVVCRNDYRARWGNRRVLRKLYEVAFKEMGLRFVWSQPKNRAAQRAALKGGFVPLSEVVWADEWPVLVLTPYTIPKRLLPEGMRRKKETEKEQAPACSFFE